MSTASARFEHPIWKAVVALLLGYGIVLAIVFALFFVLPYLLF